MIMARAMEVTVPDRCLLSPREEDEAGPAAKSTPAKAKDERSHDERAKKTIVACG
jgi:hypothetical protein